MRPIDNLVPASPEAITLGGVAMLGNVGFEDPPQSDKDKVQPPGLNAAEELKRAVPK